MTDSDGEEFYASLFHHIREGVAYCRMIYENNQPVDFEYLKVNDNFSKLTGLKNVIGRRITDIIPNIRTTNPELFEIYGRVSHNGDPEQFDSHSESFGGWLSVSVYCPKEGYFIAVFENITKRKEAEEQLKKRNMELEEMNGLMVGREEKMIELKKEIEDLKKKLTDCTALK